MVPLCLETPKSWSHVDRVVVLSGASADFFLTCRVLKDAGRKYPFWKLADLSETCWFQRWFVFKLTVLGEDVQFDFEHIHDYLYVNCSSLFSMCIVKPLYDGTHLTFMFIYSFGIPQRGQARSAGTTANPSHAMGQRHTVEKSCTKDDDYPTTHRVLTIPGGAGFCPSTVHLIK